MKVYVEIQRSTPFVSVKMCYFGNTLEIKETTHARHIHRQHHQSETTGWSHAAIHTEVMTRGTTTILIHI